MAVIVVLPIPFGNLLPALALLLIGLGLMFRDGIAVVFGLAMAGLALFVTAGLMHDVLGRFFQAVLSASLLTLVSSLWVLGRVAKPVVQSGGRFEMPLAWAIMAVLGVAMMAIFMHIRFVLHKRLGRAVAASEWTAGGAALAQLRTWTSINLGLGILVLLVTLMR